MYLEIKGGFPLLKKNKNVRLELENYLNSYMSYGLHIFN